MNEPDRIRGLEAPVLCRLTDAVPVEAEFALSGVAGEDLSAELGRRAEVGVREIGRQQGGDRDRLARQVLVPDRRCDEIGNQGDEDPARDNYRDAGVPGNSSNRGRSERRRDHSRLGDTCRC